MLVVPLLANCFSIGEHEGGVQGADCGNLSGQGPIRRPKLSQAGSCTGTGDLEGKKKVINRVKERKS